MTPSNRFRTRRCGLRGFCLAAAFCAAIFSMGCGETGGADSESSSDADSDSDTDADVDTDTSTSADADSDADGDSESTSATDTDPTTDSESEATTDSQTDETTDSQTDTGTDTAAGGAEWSYVSDAVLGVLSAHPDKEGVTWRWSQDNAFPDNWLVNTPNQWLWGEPLSSLVYPEPCAADCDTDFGFQRCDSQGDCDGGSGGVCRQVLSSVQVPGDEPTSMCVGHSAEFVDRIYTTMTSAESFVDISSLSPPDGPFRAAVRNAITFLSHNPSPPKVRIITAEIPVVFSVNTETEVADYARDLDPGSNLELSVGAYRSSDLDASFDHAKLIAVDGKVAIVGGHNMWSLQYLSFAPVNDTSMEVRGGAAVDAHRFANVLWDFVCDNKSWATYLAWSVWENTWKKGEVTEACAPSFDLEPAVGPPTATVFSVGRLGSGIADDGNQMNEAQIALMGAAQSTLRIVQQDIGPVSAPYLGLSISDWPAAELEAMAAAVLRGVDVYIILSNYLATAGGLPITEATYSNGWTVADVGDHIKSTLAALPGAPTGAELDALVCEKLHMAPFRYNPTEGTWPDGTPLPNHSKIIQVDEQALYITSNNIYPANLQEFGYIVDDSRLTADWLESYWAYAWGNASHAAISGSDAPTCEL